MQMTDVNVSMGDNNQTATLRDNYQYNKVAVEFKGMSSLQQCNYLGGSLSAN